MFKERDPLIPRGATLRTRTMRVYRFAPWHFLNFFPEPHGHGSFRPTLDQSAGATGALAAGFSDRAPRPAPTTTGSGRAAAFFFGGSAGPTSMTCSVPSPPPAAGVGTLAPFAVSAGSSSGMSSRIPSAL